ncbi:hypothetical protein [Halomonas stenophila]|uniref:Uncharacterized protein n=1 Tax=Halomonas stenophila TaxID=795312 RepID=A0A7W5EUS3_9GAMM|nr:hypothetical protein [Halomonas stenophila]MBB3231824.1 hypothetical protein [Halomonas stenophila]
MPDPKDPRHNAAWRAAQQWQERARQARPGGNAGGLRLFFTWLVFGALMIVGVVLGLFFLLVGWAMLPILRYRMKKRMERMRADQAEDVGGSFHYRETRYREPRSGEGRRHEQQVLEGDYEIKDADRDDEWR